MTSLITRAKLAARGTQDMALKLAAAAGLAQSEEAIARRAQQVWRDPSTKDLASHSHAVDGLPADIWNDLGDNAWGRFYDAKSALVWDGPLHTLMDYGCGHGAQAMAFAPAVNEIVGIDVQQDALRRCEQNVTSDWVADLDNGPRCSFLPVLIDNPEDVHDHVKHGYVDAFVSFYVFELIPGQRYGERILRMAFDVLRPGGIGFVQFKYPTGWWSQTRRLGYSSRNLADTTKYRPDEFWAMVERVGFTPGHITIAEEDILDKHYGYMSFTKPA